MFLWYSMLIMFHHTFVSLINIYSLNVHQSVEVINSQAFKDYLLYELSLE